MLVSTNCPSCLKVTNHEVISITNTGPHSGEFTGTAKCTECGFSGLISSHLIKTDT
jgi:uncharacterized Zn finger protein